VDSQTLLHNLGTVLIHWAALVGVASVVMHSRVRWRETEMGRHLMAYMGAYAVVLVLSCIALDTLPPAPPAPGDSLWFQILRLVTFVAIPLVMTQRLWLQIKAQRETRTNEPPPPLGRSD
jgi:hypothetical protein